MKSGTMSTATCRAVVTNWSFPLWAMSAPREACAFMMISNCSPRSGTKRRAMVATSESSCAGTPILENGRSRLSMPWVMLVNVVVLVNRLVKKSNSTKRIVETMTSCTLPLVMWIQPHLKSVRVSAPYGVKAPP